MSLRNLLLALAIGLAGCGVAPEEAPGPPGGAATASAPSIVLIVVDTLRADRLGCYGYRLDTSPRIDALAASGVRFSDATVQWPKTWPSMASLLSGAFPHQTGIGVVPRVLPESLRMLPEILGAAGYETAAVVANFNVGRRTGFDQGFDHFVESWQEGWQREAGDAPFENAPGKVKQYTNARLVTDQALRWLWSREDPQRPFFLWLHYMDPHGPYVPPEAYADLFAGEHPVEEVPAEVIPAYQRQLQGGRLSTDLGFYRARYDREVRYLDEQVGRLLEQIRVLEGVDPLIVLTADHGESLGEHHYYLEHGKLSYQPTAHVPLIVAGPGIDPPGRSVDAAVGLVDLSATLVELAGLPRPEAFQGTSLAALLRGDASASLPSHVFMQSGYDEEEPQLVVREGRWKLIHVRSSEERRWMSGSEYELYDLAADPGETRNLAAEQPEVVARLGAELQRWYGDGMRQDVPPLDLDTLDERSRGMLRSLGYVD